MVTGVAPNSIAAQVVNGLLAGGATVVATSHSFKPSVKAWAKQTYREHAAGDAKLWLVPANLSSYRDVDALVAWVGNVQKKTSGATTTILKPAYEPSLFFRSRSAGAWQPRRFRRTVRIPGSPHAVGC